MNEILSNTNQNIDIAVDGGVRYETANSLVQHGATILICGTGIFNKSGSLETNIQKIRNLIGG